MEGIAPAKRAVCDGNRVWQRPLRRQPEGAHQRRELLRLRAQAAGGSGRFLDQRRVLLRHLVELHHGAVDLADAAMSLKDQAGKLADLVSSFNLETAARA